MDYDTDWGGTLMSHPDQKVNAKPVVIKLVIVLSILSVLSCGIAFLLPQWN